MGKCAVGGGPGQSCCERAVLRHYSTERRLFAFSDCGWWNFFFNNFVASAWGCRHMVRLLQVDAAFDYRYQGKVSHPLLRRGLATGQSVGATTGAQALCLPKLEFAVYWLKTYRIPTT